MALQNRQFATQFFQKVERYFADFTVSQRHCVAGMGVGTDGIHADDFARHLETCHSYTNDQNLIDNYHKASRRGRSAPLNMVITETGAAKAVAKVIPELSGKLTGNAIRVPTPNVSLAIMNLELAHPVDVEVINSYLRNMSLDSPLQNQIDFTNSPEVVSSDFVGSRHAGVVDSLATIAEGNRCVLYVWYDNEFGYSCQVVRMVQQMAGLDLPTLPS